MRPAEKVKATIAAAGLKYEEFCQLCGVSRTLLHKYFKPETHMDDYAKGVKCIGVSKKLWALCENNRLPLSTCIPPEKRIEVLQEMLKSDTMKVSP